MKLKLATFVTTLALASSLQAANWLTDFPSAQAQARSENKLILVNFTGSDWCAWCIRLRNEVFTRPEFDAFAAQNVVLLEVDFPQRKALPPQVKKANAQFADKYRISGYPTILVLDADGKQVGQPFNYVPGGPKAFIAKVSPMLGDKAKSATTGTGTKPGSKPTPVSNEPPPPAFNGAPTFPPPQYSDLYLKGISGSANARYAMINNQTLGIGESGKIKVGDSVVKVKCVEITEDSAIVMVDGTNEKRELRLKGH